MDAVGRELVRRHIGPDRVGVNGFDKEVANDVCELLLRPSDVFASMDQGSKLSPVLVALVRDQRECLEHGFKTLAGCAGSVAQLGEVLKVLGDMALVPRDQDWFDAGEVLVEGRSSDARLVGYLRHGHRAQAVLRYESGGGLQDGIAYFAPVRLDGLVPELWNHARIRDGVTDPVPQVGREWR